MPAVSAYPHSRRAAAENLVVLYIFKQLVKALFVFAFDFAHKLEFYGDVIKALLAGGFCEGVVHFRPFVMLSGCGGGEIVLGFACGAEIIEPNFRMSTLVVRGFEEQVCDLLKAVGAGFRRKEGVLVPSQRFAGKCGYKILFGF